MNRLAHLKHTLPANIADNEGYPGIEFAVLDYNSPDGLETWIKSNMMEHIRSGILKYYKTCEPQYIDLSHSKNMIGRLSTGDIICMVDADNYAGKGYADWIGSVFAESGKNSIVTTLRKTNIPLRDQGGKLAFSRELVESVRGFDESLVGYGIDDVDLVNRLEKRGGHRVYIENKKFLKFIGHTNEVRLKDHHLINNIANIYMQKTTDRNVRNKVLYLLKDNTFLYADFEFDRELSSNNILTFDGWKLAKDGHRKGKVERKSEGLVLHCDDEPLMVCRPGDNGAFISGDDRTQSYWDDIPKGHELFRSLIMGYGECVNRVKFMENDQTDRVVNPQGYGRGTVYGNLDMSVPITLT